MSAHTPRRGRHRRPPVLLKGHVDPHALWEAYFRPRARGPLALPAGKAATS